MSKFVLKNIESIKGKQQFKQLIILSDSENAEKIRNIIYKKELNKEAVEIDGVLDIYEKQLEEKYLSSFRAITATMNRVANLQSVPENKFKDITPAKELIKEYEFKYQDLRIYAIKILNGKLVLLAGYKNMQAKNISQFRALKKQYLETLKHKK